MSSGDNRINDLIRVIGAERDSQPSEFVAFAEREVIRRLGGTRKQAQKRLKRGALVGLGLGLLTLGAALAFAQYYPEGLPVGTRIGGTVLMGLVGLAEAIVGVAALMKARWVMKAAWLIPFFRSPGATALGAEPPLEELLPTVGSDRQRRSTESIAQAEHQLTERLDLAAAQMSKRVRAWGLGLVLCGSYFALVGAGCLVGVIIQSFVRPPTSTPPKGLPVVFDIAFMVGFGILMIFGIVSIACGRGLRRRSPWALRAYIISVWAFFVGTSLILVPIMEFQFAFLSGSGNVAAIVLALVPVSAALLAVLLWKGTEPFTLPEVREACGQPVESLEAVASSLTPEGRTRSHALARWLVIAAVSLIVLLASASYVAALLARRASRTGEAQTIRQETQTSLWHGGQGPTGI
jgi:hypothetical protein